ncbi:hypothetical protein [Streptomyces sp. NPDC060184]
MPRSPLPVAGIPAVALLAVVLPTAGILPDPLPWFLLPWFLLTWSLLPSS